MTNDIPPQTPTSALERWQSLPLPLDFLFARHAAKTTTFDTQASAPLLRAERGGDSSPSVICAPFRRIYPRWRASLRLVSDDIYRSFPRYSTRTALEVFFFAQRERICTDPAAPDRESKTAQQTPRPYGILFLRRTKQEKYGGGELRFMQAPVWTKMRAR